MYLLSRYISNVFKRPLTGTEPGYESKRENRNSSVRLSLKLTTDWLTSLFLPAFATRFLVATLSIKPSIMAIIPWLSTLKKIVHSMY